MSLEISIDKSKTDEDIYEQISYQIEHLINPNDKIISNLSNFSSLLMQSFDKISWIGFYIRENEKLFLGPFQGNVACTEISISKGVCGTSAAQKQTIIVEDVAKYPGHIACDSNSRSEIVVPIISDKDLWGVLDVDSYDLSAFGEIDQYYLEQFCKFLVKSLSLKNFAIL